MSHPLWLRLDAQLVTPQAFAPFGQVVFPAEDGKSFDSDDAQLQLGAGVPRFYLMRLRDRGRRFRRITRHLRCTQCLGALGGKEWLIAVAAPTLPDRAVIDPADIVAFRIPGTCFIKLHVGTWHAGPYFDSEYVDFYNLDSTT